MTVAPWDAPLFSRLPLKLMALPVGSMPALWPHSLIILVVCTYPTHTHLLSAFS